MKISIAVFISTLSVQSFALEIPCSPNNEFDTNPDQLQILYKEDVDDTYLIEVEAPEQISGLSFSYMGIRKGKDGEVFIIPLKSEPKDSKVTSWFFANRETVAGTYIFASYGDRCLEGIEKQLNITSPPTAP